MAERSYNPANPTDQDLQREFKDVAGDCIQTIDKCYKLLRNPRHVELDKNRAGIIKNITWGATVQPAVDQLIRQLQFHIDRLQIILEPVKVGDLAIIRIAVLELLETSRRQDPGLIAQASDLVPGWLNDVFDGNARINVPLGVANILEIGVKDGCDLLYRAFASRDSHDSSLDARACAIRRYLNILKCQWIINTLRKTPGFPKHRSGSAFSIFVSNIEVSLCHDLQTISRTPGASVSDQDLRNLFAQADRPFLIWNPPTLRRFRSPTEREVGEEHILTVRLASNGPKEELIFFKKGRTDFRLVPTEEVEGKPQLSPYLGEVRFNLCVDKFVARYAVGEAGIPGLIPMDLYLQGHTNPVTYHMKDLQDVWAFQRAMLGYEVIGNECNVRWTAQKVFQSMSDFFAKSRRVELLGCVQVWRWDPYQETIPAPGPDANRASVESPDSSESGTMTLSPLSTAPSQRTVSSFLTTESKIHGGVLEQLQAPTAPVIAALGHSGGFYRSYVLQCELLPSTLLLPSQAHDHTPGTCSNWSPSAIQSYHRQERLQMYAGGRRREVHSSRHPELLQFSGLRHPRPIRPLRPRGLDQELESSSLSRIRTLSRGQKPRHCQAYVLREGSAGF